MPTSSVPLAGEGPTATSGRLLAALREHTREAHERLDAGLPLARGTVSTDVYVRLLRAFYSVHHPLEAALDSWRAGLDGMGLTLAERHKCSLLEVDLGFFGVAPSEIPPAVIPPIRSLAGALGAFYVVEGATLGGQVIQRQLARTLALSPDHGSAFFCSYGLRVGAMWNVFRHAMEGCDLSTLVTDMAEANAGSDDDYATLAVWEACSTAAALFATFDDALQRALHGKLQDRSRDEFLGPAL